MTLNIYIYLFMCVCVGGGEGGYYLIDGVFSMNIQTNTLI